MFCVYSRLAMRIGLVFIDVVQHLNKLDSSRGFQWLSIVDKVVNKQQSLRVLWTLCSTTYRTLAAQACMSERGRFEENQLKVGRVRRGSLYANMREIAWGESAWRANPPPPAAARVECSIYIPSLCLLVHFNFFEPKARSLQLFRTQS